MTLVIGIRLLVMMVYASVGFFMYKKGYLTNEGTGCISRLLLNVILPCVIVKSFLLENTPEMTKELLLSFLLAVMCFAVSIGTARIVYGKGQGLEQFGVSFSNAGFLGIPLVANTLGEEAVCYTVAFIAMMNVLQFSYGIYLVTGSSESISAKKILSIPAIVSFIVGICFYAFEIKLPVVATEILGTFSDMNGPIAMIILGAYFAQVSIPTLMKSKDTYKAAVLRLVAVPLISLLLLYIMPFGGKDLKLAVSILAAAPIGINVTVFAQLYGKDYTRAAGQVVVSTVLSVVTMPLIIGLGERIL